MPAGIVPGRAPEGEQGRSAEDDRRPGWGGPPHSIAVMTKFC